jgi:aldose 1-epimerase
MKRPIVAGSCLLLLIALNCSTRKETMEASSSPASIQLFTLQNKQGTIATISNFGGKVVSLLVADRSGAFDDIVLGYDSVAQYLNGNPYFGALIGRYGNRIGNAQFSLDGTAYALARNNGEHALHGGPKGFHNVIWRAQPSEDARTLVLNHLSEDGEEGYPGNLSVEVTYHLSDSNALEIGYKATTDKPTVVNLTHHSFFNLGGHAGGDILNHELMIAAGRFTPVDAGLIPTGELRLVKGTPFDFLTQHTIGERINQADEQLTFGRGYDHNFVLDKTGNEFALAARVREPVHGRVMEVWTTEPGLQFYSGNFLDGTDIGKGGKAYQYRTAFCLEAQHFPDSPNQPTFPTVVLRPGEVYRQRTAYRFSVE